MLSTIGNWLTLGYYGGSAPNREAELDEDEKIGEGIWKLFHETIGEPEGEECPAPYPELVKSLPDFGSMEWESPMGEFLRDTLSRFKPICTETPGVWTLNGSGIHIYSMGFEGGAEGSKLEERLTAEKNHEALYALRTYDCNSDLLIRSPAGQYYHLRNVES